MVPGAVGAAGPADDEMNGKKGGAPSPRVSDAGPVTPLARTPEPQSSLSDRLAVRVERARETLADTALYSTLSGASQTVTRRLGMLWEFSKSAGWIVGTSALVLVVPLLYEMDKEIVGNTANADAAPAAPGGAATPAS